AGENHHSAFGHCRGDWEQRPKEGVRGWQQLRKTSSMIAEESKPISMNQRLFIEIEP
ncbi:hypothetical protein LINPERPRIM_LOCUS1116, partial [Linum perenne]